MKIEEVQQEEIWKDVEGFPGYQVSNLGRIKSFRGWGTKETGRIMKPQVMHKKEKYRFVCLARDGKKPYFVLVHRIVAIAFVSKTDEKANKVTHRNYDVSDNRAVNLKWVR